MAALRQRDNDTAVVADFVRRLRRVALHPLALDEAVGEEQPMPGDLLRKLMRVPVEAEVRSDGTATLRTRLPDEVQFESLATRVRAFTLASDRLFWVKALDALDRLTNMDDPTLSASSRDIREEWTEATDRTSHTRAFWSSYVAGEDGEAGRGRFTDVDLAYAWLYQDVAHGDEVSTGYFDVTERYRAAVGVFSHIAVVAIETLHYINALVELDEIALPVGTFSDPVAVRVTEFVVEGALYEAEVGAYIGDAADGGPVPPHFRPAYDFIHELRQQTDNETE
ncbi:hypothetical protein [Mycobacterium sp. 236(2023)]|uniref:hypothetical protein n=1 Tax=Mycobacterium sp. 236(2023) TaxID=3038163 RepID=UPI0024157C31|nr:hypothetical protein [Mycobacterium sp. 236(2023)]MDG4666349.1 hypothetical protein [Mycobacterium sp. 236(2023)]